MAAKVLEFVSPVKSYLAFVSLRERVILTRFIDENFRVPYSVDEGGETVAIHVNLTRLMVNKIRKEFPNLHIIEGCL